MSTFNTRTKVLVFLVCSRFSDPQNWTVNGGESETHPHWIEGPQILLHDMRERMKLLWKLHTSNLKELRYSHGWINLLQKQPIKPHYFLFLWAWFLFLSLVFLVGYSQEIRTDTRSPKAITPMLPSFHKASFCVQWSVLFFLHFFIKIQNHISQSRPHFVEHDSGNASCLRISTIMLSDLLQDKRWWL